MSDECIKFISNILTLNPSKRLSAKELLNTEFLVFAEEQLKEDQTDNSKTMKVIQKSDTA